MHQTNHKSQITRMRNTLLYLVAVKEHYYLLWKIIRSTLIGMRSKIICRYHHYYVGTILRIRLYILHIMKIMCGET